MHWCEEILNEIFLNNLTRKFHHAPLSCRYFSRTKIFRMQPVFYIFGSGKDSVTSIKIDFCNNKLECQIENIPKSLAKVGQYKVIRSITQSYFLILPRKPAVIFLVTWAVTMAEIIWWYSLGGCYLPIKACGSSGTAEDPAPGIPQQCCWGKFGMICSCWNE